MKLSETNKIYFISVEIFLLDVLVNVILIGLAQMGISVSIPIYLNLMLSEGIALIPSLVYLRSQKINPWKWIPHSRLKPSVVILLILFTWLIMPLIICVNAISLLFVDNAAMGAINQMMDYPWMAAVAMSALLPALVEEFVCRGVIYHGLRHNGIWKAIFISAFLFGIMHMNFNQMSYAFVLGIILALVVEATDSIFSSMIVHFVFNSTGLMVSYLLQFIMSDALQEATVELQSNTASYYASMVSAIMAYAAIAVVTTSIAILIFYLIAKKCNRDWCMKLLFQGKTGPYPKREPVLTPLFIVFVLAALLSIFVLSGR